MANYTDYASVEAFLGVSLTPAQQTEATTEAAAASAYIDRKTRRSWGTTGIITAEQHTLMGPSLYLRYPPVTSITSVTLRSQWAGAVSDTLTAGTDYELIDPALGIVVLRGTYDPLNGWGWDMTRDDYYGRLDRIVSVTYVSTATPPADIKRAATLLVARSLSVTVPGVRAGTVTAPGSNVKPIYSVSDWNDEAERIITARRAVVFA